MGADSFRVPTASGIDGLMAQSTGASIMSEASFSVREGQSIARQLCTLLCPMFSLFHVRIITLCRVLCPLFPKPQLRR